MKIETKKKTAVVVDVQTATYEPKDIEDLIRKDLESKGYEAVDGKVEILVYRYVIFGAEVAVRPKERPTMDGYKFEDGV